MRKLPSLLLILLMGVGCNSGPTPVKPLARLDYAKLAALEPTFDAPNVPKLERKTISRSMSAPAIPGGVVAPVETAERRRLVEEAVQAALTDARNDLLQSLIEAYNAELRRKRQEKLLEAKTVREATAQAAYEATRRLFEEYARKRGPLVIRRNLLATHPDRRKRLRDPKLVEERNAKAAEIQIEIDRLDAEYEQRSKAAYAQIQSDYAESLTKIQAEIEAEREALLARAEKEAMEQAQNEISDLPEASEAVKPLVLPASPARSEKVEMTVDPPAPFDVSPSLSVDAKKLVEADAEIWAALHGYNLSTNPAAPDRTEEFLAWRRDRVGH